MKVLVSVFLLFTPLLIQSQDVLDAPFYKGKELEYTPDAEQFNDLVAFFPYGPEDYKKLQDYRPYRRSFIYVEPEYLRVRVYRWLPLEQNPHLADSVIRTIYQRENGVLQANIGTEGKRPVTDESVFKVRPLHYVQQFDGVNIDSILSDSGANNLKRFDLIYVLRDIEDYEKEGVCVKESGVLRVKEQYVPDWFVVDNLTDYIINGIRIDGLFTAYKQKEFLERMLIRESIPLVEDIEHSRLTGFRLKEDYFLDPQTGEMTSRVIGIGLVGKDQRRGHELLWIYYPEFVWGAKEAGTVFQGNVVNYASLFDNHHYASTIEEIKPIGSWATIRHDHHDSEFVVRLDAELHIQLRGEERAANQGLVEGKVDYQPAGALMRSEVTYRSGIAHGPITVYNSNGTVAFSGKMNHGKCDGQFVYNDTAGKRKAVRTFSRGTLDGKQLNYWLNGQVYMNFPMKKGDLQHLDRFYYDGLLMESGDFKDNAIHGLWTFNLRVEDRVMKLIERSSRKTELPGYNSTNLFSFQYEYEHVIREACNYSKGLGPCLTRKKVE